MLDQAGYTKGSDGIRRMPDGDAPAGLPALRPQQLADQPADRAVRRRLAEADRHQGQRQDRVRGRPDRVHRRRATFDLFEWGWVDAPDPNYQLQRADLRQPVVQGRRHDLRRPVRLVLLHQGSTTTCTPQQAERDRPGEADRHRASRCSSWSTRPAPTPMTAYYDDLQAYRSDRWTNFTPAARAGPDPSKASDKAGVAAVPERHLLLQLDHPAARPTARRRAPASRQAGGVVGGIALLWAARVRRRPAPATARRTRWSEQMSIPVDASSIAAETAPGSIGTDRRRPGPLRPAPRPDRARHAGLRPGLQLRPLPAAAR